MRGNHFQGRLLIHSFRALLACSLLVPFTAQTAWGQEAKQAPHETHQRAPEPPRGQQALPGLNLEGFLLGLRVNNNRVDLQVREGKMAGYQTTPAKKAAFMTVAEAAEYITREGNGNFVFDVTDTISGQVLSFKAVKASAPNSTTLRLTGLSKDHIDPLREMTKRLKGYGPDRPVVTFRLANFKMVDAEEGKRVPMKDRVDYLLHIQKGVEATKLPGDMPRWTFAFRGVKASLLHANGEQETMTPARFLMDVGAQRTGGGGFRPNGSLVVFKDGRPIRVRMEFSNFTYDEKADILTMEGAPLKGPWGDNDLIPSELEEKVFSSPRPTTMFLDLGDVHHGVS